MDKKTETTEGPGPMLNPLTGWEAASRWNSAAFELMTKGFQQWLTLVTNSLVVPEKNVTPAPAAAQSSRALASDARPSRPRASDTRAKPKRPARTKAAGARKSRRV
jgi:hypothetical protein